MTMARHLKFLNERTFLEKNESLIVDDYEDLNKAIDLLKKEFALAKGKTILCEIWIPVVPQAPAKINGKTVDFSSLEETQAIVK